jgi:hypothetical protein
MAVKWERSTQYIYAAVNVAIYVSALVSGLVPSAVFYLVFIISGLIRYTTTIIIVIKTIKIVFIIYILIRQEILNTVFDY